MRSSLTESSGSNHGWFWSGGSESAVFSGFGRSGSVWAEQSVGEVRSDIGNCN